MKYAGIFSIALAGFMAVSSAQPHGKIRHRHIDARAVVTVIATQTVDQFGNLLGGPTPAPQVQSPSVAVPEPAAVVVESDSEEATETEEEVAEVSSAASSVPTPAEDYDELDPAPVKDKAVTGLNADFPDGELSCSTFPSDYGALATDWVTKDSWSGIQFDEQQSSGEIRLANADGAGSCKEGYYCSYACPPGYSKTQWPEDQPSNGESVGGLICKNGKLCLTRPKSSKKLCVKGAENTTVVNKLSKSVAICRTDYPGTEKMSVPTVAEPGATEPLTVPYATDSYAWNGKPTTAQYYVNDAGVSVEDGCVWGEPDGGKGNWAPLVFGTGVNKDGETYLSVFQNPLNPARANYNVKITTGDPDQECKYEGGKFYGPGTQDGAGTGCTVCASSKAQYIFY